MMSSEAKTEGRLADWRSSRPEGVKESSHMLKLDKTENNFVLAAFCLSQLPPGVTDCMTACV